MQRIFSKLLMLDMKRAGIWFGIGSLCLAGLVNLSPAGKGDDTSKILNASSSSPSNQLQREGSKVSQLTGYFRQSSGRITFVPKENSKSSLVCLENLMLQRIADSISGKTEFGAWVVSGEVTEYRNANYLVVKTAQQVE